MNHHVDKMRKNENETKIPAIIAPPRRNRKNDKSGSHWSNNCSTPVNFLPYMAYSYPYPYQCGYAIPLIPFPFGVMPPLGYSHFPQSGVSGKHEQLRKRFECIHFSPFNDTQPEKKGLMNNIDTNKYTINQNVNLFRNESLPNVNSSVETVLAVRPQSANILRNFENSNVSPEELLEAFKKLEQNVYNFKQYISQNLLEDYTESKHKMLLNEPASTYKSSSSICSSSFENNQKQNEKCTFSQRIEEISNQSRIELSSPTHTENDELFWVLKAEVTMETYLPGGSSNDEFSERRKKVLKTLCFGQGFDQSDWLLFQQLLAHPCSIIQKMKLLNAELICTENINAGVASLRNSLLSISKYGESLLNLASGNISEYSYINLNQDQRWKNIKGCLEILQLFGYRRQGFYQLCVYSGTKQMNKVFIAELTLDILILAEEFRLYLDGIHSNPIFVTQLFKRDEKYNEIHKINDYKYNPMKVNNPGSMQNYVKNILPERNQGSDNKIEKSIENIDTKFLIHKCVKDEEPTDKIMNEDNINLVPALPLKTRNKIKMGFDIKQEKLALRCKNNIRKNKKTSNEEHIYEEISEVKIETQKLYKQNRPPPLPKKIGIMKDRNVSIQNKLSIKKHLKKKSAPMPPFFNCDKQQNSLAKDCKANKTVNNAKHNSIICSQCGKLSVKNCSTDYEEIQKNKHNTCLMKYIENTKYINERHFNFHPQNIKNISNDQYYHFDRLLSRSVDSIIRHNKIQKLTDILIKSVSLPSIKLSNKYNKNDSISITIIESKRVTEHSKKLDMNTQLNSPSQNLNIKIDVTADKKEVNSKNESKFKLLNEREHDPSTANSEIQNNALNFDAIPFIDSTEELLSCSNDFVMDEKSKEQPSAPAESIKMISVPHSSNVSVESLEVKDILFRKCFSDSALDQQNHQNNDNAMYREPVIFRAQNFGKINNEKQIEEDRYEIPEVPLNERNGINPKLPSKIKKLENNSSGEIGIPKRPCRKLKSPPLPPKPKEKIPPPLPPKGLLSNLTLRNLSSKISIARNNKTNSSQQQYKAGGSLPILSEKFSSTGLIFVGNKLNQESCKDNKSRKYWPFLFCSCLPITVKNV